MSEDLHELPGEPDDAGRPLAEASASQGAGQDAAPPASQETPVVPPVSESILPEQPVYPPRPEFYAQMPASGPSGVPPVVFPPQAPVFPPQPGMPGGWPPVQGRPVFPPPPGYVPYGYRFDPVPQAQPLPLSQAIRELPAQYKKMLFKPGVRSFLEEQGKAEWGIIWVQLLFQLLVGAVLGIPEIVSFNQSTTPGSILSTGFYSVEIVVLLLLGPAFFFGSVGIQWLLARAFKGTGSFKQQAYNQLLFSVPLGIISSVLSTVFVSLSNGMGGLMSFILPTSSLTTQGYNAPIFNVGFLAVLMLFDLFAIALGVYQIVLNVFSLMATHRMSGGRATACVLIPPAVLSALVFILALVVVFIAVAAFTPSTYP